MSHYNPKIFKNRYTTIQSVPCFFEYYCNYEKSVYNKMINKDLDQSGTVWIDQGPTLWPGSSTVLGDVPGISWV